MTPHREIALPGTLEEITVPAASYRGLEESLRLLARFLVTASRKAAADRAALPPAAPRIPVDVAADHKVGLDRG